MRTLTPKASEIQGEWYVVDAADQVLGRLATKVASVLRGKHKPQYSPHLDMGDHVVIINADKVKLTRNKELQKEYKSFSGYPGGLKTIPYRRMMDIHPEHIIEHAVKGMLPKNALGRQLFSKLRVYTGPENPHVAQKPKPLEV